jgi:hypothetical protein
MRSKQNQRGYTVKPFQLQPHYLTFCRAIRTNIVLSLIATIISIVIVVIIPTLISLPLPTLHIPLWLKPPLSLSILLLVRVPIGTILIKLAIRKTIVFAIFPLPSIISIIILLTIARLKHVQLTLVFSRAPLTLNVGFGKRFQVDDVVGVVGGASASEPGLTGVGGTQSKVGQLDGFDDDVIFVVGVEIEGGV